MHTELVETGIRSIQSFCVQLQYAHRSELVETGMCILGWWSESGQSCCCGTVTLEHPDAAAKQS